MKRLAFILALYLVYNCVFGLAQDIQVRAEALVQHARELSDIRSPGSPPFQMKVTFNFVGNNLEPVQGTYIETWISKSQWRRETVIGDLKRIEIGGQDRRWLIFPDLFPHQALQLPLVMAAEPPYGLDVDFGSIEERSSAGTLAQCTFTNPASKKLQAAFCFDKEHGLLLEKNLPEHRPHNVVAFACEYGSFGKLGEHWYPYNVKCFEDRHDAISASVLTLMAQPAVDPALFVPPKDAIEVGVCSGKITPPSMATNRYQFSNNGIVLPGSLDPDRMTQVPVWLVVDAKGIPRDIKILRDVSKAAKDRTTDTVRDWRFLPAKCDGKSMPMEMRVDIPYAPR